VPHFVDGHRELRAWVDAILACRPHAIFYPEIGMDVMTAKLAALRLAPVQFASWGHPMTTGLPTIDAFLSAAAFEPTDGDAHYRERLVRLPNLGVRYRPLGVTPSTAEVPLWNFDADVPLLVCAGTPYKYQPTHDHLYVDIARRLGRAKFVFFLDVAARASHAVQDRLAHAFTQAGLDPREFLVLLPRQEPAAFFDILGRSDVYLDTLGFSGFNTVMQAVECGLPVVAFAGRFMRGRLASGVLAQMGLHELVADDDEGYVNRVVRLCRDRAYWSSVRERIVSARSRLFEDSAPVRAFEEFVERSLRDGGVGAP
jgi:predicted O-linked N-acetylglucosamine transferase (SPINDLY family)